jgi:sporulation protein YlmC with PRC-barrel domain
VELRKGARVVTSDGERVGIVDRVVLDPVREEVTHLVVSRGLVVHRDKLVPVSYVKKSTDDEVTLNKPAGEIDSLPEFEETHYVPLRMGDRSGEEKEIANPLYWYPPIGTPLDYYGYPIQPFYRETERHYPEGSVPLKEGARVESEDGTHVGHVEAIFTEKPNNRATHLLLSKGVFLRERKLVPTSWIKKVEEDTVHLAVNAQFIAELPEYRA